MHNRERLEIRSRVHRELNEAHWNRKKDIIKSVRVLTRCRRLCSKKGTLYRTWPLVTSKNYVRPGTSLPLFYRSSWFFLYARYTWCSLSHSLDLDLEHKWTPRSFLKHTEFFFWYSRTVNLGERNTINYELKSWKEHHPTYCLPCAFFPLSVSSTYLSPSCGDRRKIDTAKEKRKFSKKRKNLLQHILLLFSYLQSVYY